MFVPLMSAWFRKNPAQRATLLVRGTSGRDTLAAVRDQLASLHPDLTVFNARTVREDLDRLNTWVQWDAAIYEALGVFALLLACIGLGGVTAYAVVWMPVFLRDAQFFRDSSLGTRAATHGDSSGVELSPTGGLTLERLPAESPLHAHSGRVDTPRCEPSAVATVD